MAIPKMNGTETLSDPDSPDSGHDCVDLSPHIVSKPVEKKPPLFVVVPNYIPKIPKRTAPGTNLTHLGSVTSVVDGCVIIKAQSSAPVVDAGTAVFLEGGTPLGEIYETFGPVVTPLYVVVLPNSNCLTNSTSGTTKKKKKAGRRNNYQTVVNNGESNTESAPFDKETEPSLPESTIEVSEHEWDASSKAEGNREHPESLSKSELDTSTAFDSVSHCDTVSDTTENPTTDIPEVKPGDVIYFVKDDPELTITVFYSQLIQTKGSDASWVGDVEPPPEELDFSDDEQERLHKLQLKGKRHLNFIITAAGSTAFRCELANISVLFTCIGGTYFHYQALNKFAGFLSRGMVAAPMLCSAFTLDLSIPRFAPWCVSPSTVL